MKVILFIALLVGFTSCQTKPLSAEEQAVRILRKSDAPTSCKEIGRVHAPGLASFTEEGRDNDLKKATAALGGDTVQILRRDENNTVYGMAFSCNKTAS